MRYRKHTSPAHPRAIRLPPTPPVPATYGAFLDALKRRVHEARLRAFASANREMITPYFELGRSIVARQVEDGWGSHVMDRLAGDLHASFPDMEGFSPRNLPRMRAFYLTWRDVEAILPQPVADLPWGHNALLLEKLPSPELRRRYAERTFQHGWSRAKAPQTSIKVTFRLAEGVLRRDAGLDQERRHSGGGQDLHRGHPMGGATNAVHRD